MNPNSILSNATQSTAQDIADNNQNFQNNFNINPLNVSPSTGSTSEAIQALQGSSPSSSAPAQAGHQPSLLERLLPTVGAVGGGILGDFLGPIGGVAGAAGGSALGKSIEDKLTGQAGGNGVLGAAAGGAVGQGVGEGVGALLGAGGKGLSGFAAGNTQKADKAAQAASIPSEVDRANTFKNNYGAMTDKTQARLKLGTNSKFADSMGYDGTDPYQLKTVGDALTNEYNGVVDNALQNSKDIDMSGFNNQIFNTMKNTGTTDLSTSALGKALQDYADKAGVDPGATIPDSMPATQARMLQQAVGRQQGSLQKIVNAADANGQPNIQAESELNTMSKIYKDLGNRLYSNNPEANEAVANTNIDDEGRTLLQQKYGQQLGNHIADTINNSSTAKELVNKMQPAVQMDNASNIAIDDIENAPGTARAIARAKMGEQPPVEGGKGMFTPLNMASVGEATLGHHPAAMLLPAVAKIASNPAVQAKVGQGLTGIGGSAVPGILGAAIGSTPSAMSGPANANSQIQDTAVNNQTSPFQAGILASLDTGQLGNIGGLAKDQATLNAAQAAEQNLASNYNLAGGAQGPFGGGLNILGSLLTGGEASRYNAQAEADRQAIVNAENLMSGGNAPASSIATPGLTSNQSAAQASLGNIQSIIQALQGTGASPAQGIIGAVR